MTITGRSIDIDPGKLDDMEAFLREYCMAGMFALERGDSMSHLYLTPFKMLRTAYESDQQSKADVTSNLQLYLQRVLRMRPKTVTVRGLTVAIKRHLQWDEGKQPFGSRIMCRGITEKQAPHMAWPGGLLLQGHAQAALQGMCPYAKHCRIQLLSSCSCGS